MQPEFTYMSRSNVSNSVFSFIPCHYVFCFVFYHDLIAYWIPPYSFSEYTEMQAGQRGIGEHIFKDPVQTQTRCTPPNVVFKNRFSQLHNSLVLVVLLKQFVKNPILHFFQIICKSTTAPLNGICCGKLIFFLSCF